MSATLDRVRRANPVPNPDGLLDRPGYEALHLRVQERSGLMQTESLEKTTQHSKQKRPWLIAVAAFAVVLAAVAAILLAGSLGEETVDYATPQGAQFVVESWAQAITDGDGEAAVALLSESYVADDVAIVSAMHFLAASSERVTLESCIVEAPGDGTQHVRCRGTFSTPILSAQGLTMAPFGADVDAEGKIVLLNPGSRFAMNDFATYAKANYPDRFAEVCAEGVSTAPAWVIYGYEWTGPCGEFEAEIGSEVADWILAGRP